MKGDGIFRWYYGQGIEPDSYNGPCDTREEAIEEGRDTYGDDGYSICEADKMVPRLDVLDWDFVVGRIEDCNPDCWSEDGPEDFGATTEQTDELERMLAATLREWNAKHGLIRAWGFATMRNQEYFPPAEYSLPAAEEDEAPAT